MATEAIRERAERLHAERCPYEIGGSHSDQWCAKDTAKYEAELEAFRAAVLEEAAQAALQGSLLPIDPERTRAELAKLVLEGAAENVRALKEAKNG